MLKRLVETGLDYNVYSRYTFSGPEVLLAGSFYLAQFPNYGYLIMGPGPWEYRTGV